MRAHSVGAPKAATSPITENIPTIVPPKASLAPASRRIEGIHVNIEYVISEVMPNMPAIPQATGENARPDRVAVLPLPQPNPMHSRRTRLRSREPCASERG